jgi:potassium channel subfamily K
MASPNDEKKLGLFDKAAAEVSYKKIRDPLDYATKDEREAEEDFLAPARWWFATTLFPLVAGTFGPVASAFSICAIAQEWRVVPSAASKEQEGHQLRDPPWLIAVNAVSLGVAICTNVVMLLQMAEKVSFHIATPLVIGGWYVSSLLLIGLVGAASSQLALPPGAVMAQGFYYACIAAALYGIIGSMLVATALGVIRGKYAHKYKLTTAQRTLMLQTIVFLGYVLAAAGVYARIEGWSYLDGGRHIPLLQTLVSS